MKKGIIITNKNAVKFFRNLRKKLDDEIKQEKLVPRPRGFILEEDGKISVLYLTEKEWKKFQKLKV